MNVTLLLPRLEHTAIEERYAARQTELLLRRGGTFKDVAAFDADAPIGVALEKVTTELVLVATSLLIVPPPAALQKLRAALLDESDATVAVLSGPDNALQQARPPSAYLTLREFERVAEQMTPQARQSVTWNAADPLLYLARTDRLDGERRAAAALAGLHVTIAGDCFVHRFASQRGQLREDLLARVDRDATNILEFGCGEGALGAAIKQRQPARVVGIELDPEAAAVARTRLDDVIGGDVRTLIERLADKFDFIIGGDIVEHLDDPWEFLRTLRKVARADTKLLLSLPNIANFSIVSDLLVGRFDYVYLGILCAGHLRFFTRRTIEDLLMMSGWSEVKIESQPPIMVEAFDELKQKLDAAGIDYSAEDLLAPGWYVTAVPAPSSTRFRDHQEN